MESFDIVAILGTGVSGFSFLMLYMGYKLTSDVQQKILDTSVLEIELDKLKTWEKITEKHVINTRVFLAFSLVFLVAGLIMLAYRPDTKVILTLTPMEQEFPPIVYAQENQIKLDENGKGLAFIKNEHALTIDNKIVFNELKKMRENMLASEASERALVEEAAKKTNDSGFGNIF